MPRQYAPRRETVLNVRTSLVEREQLHAAAALRNTTVRCLIRKTLIEAGILPQLTAQ